MLPVTTSHLILGFILFFIGDVVPLVKIGEAVCPPQRKVALAPDGEHLHYKYTPHKEPVTTLFPPDKKSAPLIEHLVTEIGKDDGRNDTVTHTAVGKQVYRHSSKCLEPFTNEAHKKNNHTPVPLIRPHIKPLIRRFQYLGSRPRQGNAPVIRVSANGDQVDNNTREKENKQPKVSNNSVSEAVKNGLGLGRDDDMRGAGCIPKDPVFVRGLPPLEAINTNIKVEGDLPDTGVIVTESNLTTLFNILYYLYNIYWNNYHRSNYDSGNKYYTDYNKSNYNIKDQNQSGFWSYFWPYYSNDKSSKKEAVGNKDLWSVGRGLNSYQGRNEPFKQDNYHPNHDEDNSWWSPFRPRYWSNSRSTISQNSGTGEHSNDKKNIPESTKIVSTIREIKNHQHPWHPGYGLGYYGYNGRNIPNKYRPDLTTTFTNNHIPQATNHRPVPGNVYNNIKPAANARCDPNGNLFFQNSDDCSTYFTCNLGFMILSHCPRGFYYIPEHRRCEYSVPQGCRLVEHQIGQYKPIHEH